MESFETVVLWFNLLRPKWSNENISFICEKNMDYFDYFNLMMENFRCWNSLIFDLKQIELNI